MPPRVNSESTCFAGSSTDAMIPEPAMPAISRERRQITRTPSSSDSAPQTTAAATSPIEYPMTALGRAPYAVMAAASATCIVNSVGCSLASPVTSSGAVIASVTEKPDSAATSGSIRATVAVNSGSSASSWAPI